jgi:signal transduction histidine kinase
MQRVYKRFILLSVLVIALLALSGYFIIDSFTTVQEQTLDKSSMILVKSIEEGINKTVGANPGRLTGSQRGKLRSFLSNLVTPEGNILSILVIDTSRTIIVGNDKKVEGSVFRDENQLALLSGKETKIIHGEWDGGVPIMDVIVPVLDENDVCNGYIRVTLSRAEIESALQDLTVYLLPVLAVFAVLFILSIVMIARAYSKPLDSMRQALTKLNEEDYSYRVDYHGKDEFTDAFVTLNKTFEKVGVLQEGYKKAEKRITSLLQAVNECVLVLDLNRHVSSFNQSALKLFQSSKDEFREMFAEVLSNNIELNGMLSRVIKQGEQVIDKDLLIFLPDNTELLVKMTMQTLQEDDHAMGIVISFRDLKVMAELENNLMRSMKFGVIANLASSISHEIKNPLSSLALHAEVLNTRIKEQNFEGKEQAMTSLEVLKNESGRLNRIIQQFLTLARPSRIELDLVNLNSIVTEVVSLVQKQGEEQRVEIYVRQAPELEMVYGDRDQLGQVLLNIALNALAAMESGGKLYIRTRQEKKKAYIDVRDTGNGMSKEVQARVFELYYSTKKNGGGIGLAISRNIMEAHEGKLYFESVVGKGTIFTMELPLKDATTMATIRTHTRLRSPGTGA